MSFHETSTAARIRRYRKLAAKAVESAARAKDETARKSFLLLAEGWEQLAATVERDFRRDST